MFCRRPVGPSHALLGRQSRALGAPRAHASLALPRFCRIVQVMRRQEERLAEAFAAINEAARDEPMEPIAADQVRSMAHRMRAKTGL
eukprot:8765533-Pyramimonas_sp.AAC.1